MSVGTFTLEQGNWVQLSATLPSFYANNFVLYGGNSYQIPSITSFLRATGGDGSPGNPFKLVDVYGLQGMATYWAYGVSPGAAYENFSLATNIDASGTVNWNNGAGFVPIGGGTWEGGQTIFQYGSLNGNGYSISGLYINLPTTNYVGLFGETSVSIENVNLINANITGNEYVGALVGDSGATITNSSATGSVTAAANYYYGGGLVGLMYTGASITDSWANVNVSVPSSFAYAGGLVGANYGGSISNSYATGTVQTGSSGTAGGLVGYNYSGSVSYSYAVGSVSAATAGALFGYNGASLTDVYWKGGAGQAVGSGSSAGTYSAALQTALPSGFGPTVWGIVPNQTYPFLLSQAGVITGTVYTTYGGSNVGSGVSVSDVINGTAGSYSVTTGAGGTYVFFAGTGGIPSNAQVVVYTSSGIGYQQNAAPAVSGLNIYGAYLGETTSGPTASGLASGYATAVGTHSGLLPTVANLLINATGTTFAIDQAINTTGTLVLSAAGQVSQSAAITAADVLLTGNGSYALTNTGNAIGTLAANIGSLSLTDSTALTVNTVAGTSDVTATGAVTLIDNSITLTASTGLISAAGQTVTLAPYTAGGTITIGTGSSGFVLTAATVADITAGTLAVGNTSAGNLTVNQSIAPNATDLALVSGGSITQSSGTITVAGLGLEGTTITLSGTNTATSFATSSTSAPTLIVTGNLTIADIGPVNGISWTDSTTATLKAGGNITIAAPITNTGAGNLLIYADTLADDNGAVTFTGAGAVNFANSSGNVTIFDHPTSYPTPSSFNVTMGTGTYATYMLVNSANDIVNIANNLNGDYALNQSIDLSGIANFAPLGSDYNPFFGIFDGQNYTIKNLTISTSADDAGFFGYIYNGAIVRNVSFVNASVTTGGGYGAGILAGGNNGTITNVSVSGTVTDTSLNVDSVGGLVGFEAGSITSSSAHVTVTGGEDVGGLVGVNFSGTIGNSYATGSVTGTPNSGDANSGGLAGANLATITSSYATGSVVNNGGFGSPNGGLVGDNQGSISQSYATGNVTGGWLVGGLVGYLESGSVSGSYATGNVSGTGGTTDVGGLVGTNTGSIGQSYATGAVSLGYYSGGLVGYNNGNITQSYATGSVTQAAWYAGGLIGLANGGSVDQVYATGYVGPTGY